MQIEGGLLQKEYVAKVVGVLPEGEVFEFHPRFTVSCHCQKFSFISASCSWAINHFEDITSFYPTW